MRRSPPHGWSERVDCLVCKLRLKNLETLSNPTVLINSVSKTVCFSYIAKTRPERAATRSGRQPLQSKVSKTETEVAI